MDLEWENTATDRMGELVYAVRSVGACGGEFGLATIDSETAERRRTWVVEDLVSLVERWEMAPYVISVSKVKNNQDGCYVEVRFAKRSK